MIKGGQRRVLTIDLLRVAAQLRQQTAGPRIVHSNHAVAAGRRHHRAARRAGVNGLDASLKTREV